jgi:hypothetical protein
MIIRCWFHNFEVAREAIVSFSVYEKTITQTPVLYFTVILDIPRDHFTVAGSSPNKDCRYYFVCAEFILYLILVLSST